MTVNNSDYKKPRTNLLDVTSETFKSETNVSLIENTFNRLLTKDETVEVSGIVGSADTNARIDRRIVESDSHRQAFQLQPVIHTTTATVNHTKTSRDIYNKLVQLGVDLDRLPVWGDTERFNYAPPVDLDKLINYSDYYWFDDLDQYDVPQYITIKNKCSVATARLSQKHRDTSGLGDSTPIFNVSTTENTLLVLGDVTKMFLAGAVIDVSGSMAIDGQYTVVSSAFEGTTTTITVDSQIPSTQYGGGVITFATALSELTSQKNAVCDGSAGWDSSAWDDSAVDDRPADDAVQLQYLRVESPAMFSVITRRHPEYLDSKGNVVVADARPLWSWMDQPKPEFVTNWDANALASTVVQNDWQVENKWIHKLDLPAGAITKSQRAMMPIIEYLPNLQLNTWSYTAHKWKYRADPIRDEFAAVDVEPTFEDYSADDFVDKWLYVGASQTVPVDIQEENPSANLMAIDSRDADYKLTTYVGAKITQLDPQAKTLVVAGTFVAGNASIQTPDGVFDVLIADATTSGNTTTITLDTTSSVVGVTDGDILLRPAGTRPYNVALFTEKRSHITVAGQQNTRVYVDGREQVGTYTELLSLDSGTFFVSGIMLDFNVSSQSRLEVGIDPSAKSDADRSLWNVRTLQYANDQVFRESDRKTTPICVINYRLHQQRKVAGVPTFPLFDVFHPDGTTAFRASELFTYAVDQSSAVEFKVGLRVKRTESGKVYHFKQTLVDYDGGPMYCYRDLDVTPTLSSIWKTSEATRYVPRYVDANNRADGEEYYVGTTKVTASVPAGTGDWEIPSQLYFNAEHENRVEVTSVQLLEHANTILRNQLPLTGYTPSTQYGHRLLDRIDYSVGGTIHEHNDSWDLLASAMFATNTTPLDVLDFAATSYDSAVAAQEEYVIANAYTALLDRSPAAISDITKTVVDAAISAYELNANNNRLFGDTSAYTDVGVKSWPASLATLGMAPIVKPSHLSDPKLGIEYNRHHDGHLSYNRITQGTTLSVIKRLIRTRDSETQRFRGWTPQQAADGGAVVASYKDIDVSRLAVADFWANGSTLLRFNVTAISPMMPPLDSPVGSLWLKTPDNQLFTRTANPLEPWTATADAPGDVSAAWQPIVISDILSAIVSEIETRLYENAISQNDGTVAFDVTQYVKSPEDEQLYAALEERMFKEFVVRRQISFPYASTYVPTDPFTWNVKQAQQYADAPYGTAYKWKATWEGVYKEAFGTSYPHLEPWVLQGYTSEPLWWAAEYAGTTRRWKAAMWDAITSGVVPDGQEAPASLKRPSFVPVNITREITNAAGDVLYALDDLFPVYDSRLLAASNADIMASTGRPLISVVDSTTDFKAAYEFGDESPIELEWLRSAQRVVDIQKIAFIMQPMRYMHATWGNKYLYVGGLNVNKETRNVFSHTATIFHGDIIDGKAYKAKGLNQLYAYSIRQTGVDFKASNIRDMWTTWTAKMAYQFGGYINAKSLSVGATGISLIKDDYSVISKKSPGYKTLWLDSLDVAIAGYGASDIRRGTRIPQGDGKDWTFTVSLPAANSRTVKYHGTRRFEFSVVDEASGVMTVGGRLPWNTGDLVYLDSTMYLPFPLDVVYRYYVIVVDADVGHFAVARTPSEAHAGKATQLRTSGDGIQYIGEVHSTFYAYGGANTDVAWKHNVLDVNQVIERTSPFTVTGIQNLIDVIDGYVSFKKSEGFVFNDSSEKELDTNTNRLVSWQTEVERLVDGIYVGLGFGNTAIRQYGSTTQLQTIVDGASITAFRVPDVVPAFAFAAPITFFTSDRLPSGLRLNTTYYAIPSEVDPRVFQVATTPLNAYEEVAVQIADDATSDIFAGSFTAPSATTANSIEVNPFRYNLWVKTPEGILADIFSGGDSGTSGKATLYDQYGRPIPKGAAMVFRSDLQTHIKVRPTIVNDVLIDNATPTTYNLIHIGGVNVYIDGYEHIVLFNDYTTGNQMIYDSFVGMSVPRFAVEFQRSASRTLRPTIGGYFANGTSSLRNIEASVDDMRSYYQTYDVNESSDYVDYARGILGYESPSYLDHLNVPLKSKFLFWKGMIQQKGSRNAIRSFINSQQFVDAKVDEFWAYKLSDFGDSRPTFNPRIRLNVDDASDSDLRLEFTDDVVGPVATTRFNRITLADQTRWVDLPTVRRDLGGRNLSFEASAVAREFDISDLNVVNDVARVVIDFPLDLPVVEVFVDSVWKPQQFTVVNSKAFTTNVGSATRVRVTGYQPNAEVSDPIDLIDVKSSTIVQRTKLWNPHAGIHYNVPMAVVDFMCSADPVDYSAASDWVADKVGTIWADLSTFVYVPYDDTTIFPDLSDRTERWGQLAEFATADVYEWTSSSTLPSVWAQDVDNSGTPLKVWSRLNSDGTYSVIDLKATHSVIDHDDNFKAIAVVDSELEVATYVNGILVANETGAVTYGDVLANGSVVDQYQLKASDYVTFVLTPSAAARDSQEYIEDFKYITVAGETQSTYYFWVANKASKSIKHNTSAADIRMQLTAPQVPYHIFSNCLPAVKNQGSMVPTRYTQITIRDVADKVSVDSRYVLQFTRFFNLRDTLAAGQTPLDLKNKHSEWFLFRQQQTNKIPEDLWNLATEAVVGYKLSDLENGILSPVPSLERTVYDTAYGETSRFGLGDGQAFVDRQVGLASIVSLLESSTLDTSPVDKYDFLAEHSFDTPVNIRNAMSYIFVNFPSSAVNAMFFELLHDALADKRDYQGLFKTSWIALHGIKILETVGTAT